MMSLLICLIFVNSLDEHITKKNICKDLLLFFVSLCVMVMCYRILNCYVICRYCTSHMQHLGLLPFSTKAASKATKNGQHNHHSVEHSTRILSKLGNTSDLLPSSVVSAVEVSKTAGDPYLFHDVDVKSVSTVAIDKALSNVANSVPIARLYPELAEKLDLESTRSDGHKAVNMTGVSSRRQSLNHVSVDKPLKDGVKWSSEFSRPATASLSAVVGSQYPVMVTSSSQSSVKLQTSNTPNLTRLMLDPVITRAAVDSTPLIQYPWQTSVSGGSAASMVPTSPQLLSQALQGLLNATSAAQTVSLPCLKFPTTRSDVTVPSIAPNQNASHLQRLHDPTLFDTGRTTVEQCLPVVQSQTVASPRSTAEDSGQLKPQPCVSCLVRPRPRPRPHWRHRGDLRLGRKPLHKSAWKLYSDHVARVDCNADILPCGMLQFIFRNFRL